MISLDGSFGEGGGQIVRTALALSCITGKAFEVINIRKGRCEPGLKQQHLHCATSLQKMCNATVQGAMLGSTSLTFEPGIWNPKSFDVDLETAGSITLYLQAVMLPFLLGKKRVSIIIGGGTDVKWSMPIDYFKHVLVPQLMKWAEVDVTILKRGYYPKGGGRVELQIKPAFSLDSKHKAPILNLKNQGKLVHVRGVSHASKDLESANVADRQAKAASFVLGKCGEPVNILSEYSDTLSTGSGITLWGIFGEEGKIDMANPIRIGADCLGERGKKAEDIGIESAERFKNEMGYGSPVDEYLSDNLIPLVALFGGSFKASKISNHLLTNVYVVEMFLGKGIITVDHQTRIIESRGWDHTME